MPRAARILTQCADALQAAHELGIVHRDLKPDNIMVITSRAKDTVKVVDFGIAKATGADTGGQKVTRTGLVVGTPEYMSPEQLSGDTLDGRSDLYSLALVFYRMITGALPFKADTRPGDHDQAADRRPGSADPGQAGRPFPAPGSRRSWTRPCPRWPSERFATATEFAKDVANVTAGMTASVDTEGATQMVRAGGEVKGQVPATRVDPSVDPAARHVSSPPRRRGRHRRCR